MDYEKNGKYDLLLTYFLPPNPNHPARQNRGGQNKKRPKKRQTIIDLLQKFVIA